MIIDKITVGAFQVNNYLIVDEETKDAALIDAGGDYEATMNLAQKHNANIKYIFNTHAHLDHIAGDYDLQTKSSAKVLLHKEDEFLVGMLKEHLKLYGMPEYEEPKVDRLIEDGEEITVGSLKFKVIHTPGHSPGGVCYLIGNKLFSGDTLFAGAVGRTDLPQGSYEQLEKSVKEKLYTLDENIEVYPGHGPKTSIGYEKKNNPFFKAD